MSKLTLEQLEDLTKRKARWVTVHTRSSGVDGQGSKMGVMKLSDIKGQWGLHTYVLSLNVRVPDEVMVKHERLGVVYQGTDKEKALEIFNGDMRNLL